MLKLARGYYWEGVTCNGQRLSGKQQAQGVDIVRAQLQRRGIIANKIEAKRILLFNFKTIKPHDIARFSRQLAGLLTAGIPLVLALDLLAHTTDHGIFQDVLNTLKAEMENGSAMSIALGRYPHYFNRLYCGLIRIGEQSGDLGSMFARLAEQQEKNLQIKAKVYKALLYPSTVLILSFGVLLMLLLLVVPQFEQLFTAARVPLPSLTQRVITLAHVLQRYGLAMLLTVIGIISLLLKQRWPRLHRLWYQALLLLPFLGVALKNALLAHITRTLATSLSAGLPLVEALAELAETIENPCYKDAILDLRQAIISGLTLANALQLQPLFPQLVQQMVAVGQVSGTLSQMLTKLADLMTEQLDQCIAQFGELLEPLLMLLLGLVIGVLIIALYLPIFALGSVI